MARLSNLEADKIVDSEFSVLNKGFVRLVDYMGSDARIAEAARVSYNSGKTIRDDEALIDYLYKNGHTSPFEQVVLLFHIKMPLFVARQWLRHRTARLNEISARYSVMSDDFYIPKPEDVRTQDKKDKQSSSPKAVSSSAAECMTSELQAGQADAYKSYKSFIEKGVAREMARINLPLSLYTEVYWQMDLHNLFHFLYLRLSSHAQKEIREYAKVIFSICKTVCPIATRAFEEHRLNAKHLSKKEVEAVLSVIEESGSLSESMLSLKEKLKEGSI